MATPKRARTRKVAIDIDAIVCLDMSHQWRLVEQDISSKGWTLGLPRRAKICMVCGSLKIETVNWKGYVVSRQYKPDPVYLANSRLLSDAVQERRAEYRKLLLGRAPSNACEKCGMVHDSADCPGLL